MTTLTSNKYRPTLTIWNKISFTFLLFLMVNWFGPGQAFDISTKLNLKPTKYTEWSKNITYQSTTNYNARGMKPLYEITQKVMWILIGGEDPLPNGK